jgi:hypothetical protein
LSISSEFLVSNFAFKINLYRYKWKLLIQKFSIREEKTPGGEKAGIAALGLPKQHTERFTAFIVAQLERHQILGYKIDRDMYMLFSQDPANAVVIDDKRATAKAAVVAAAAAGIVGPAAVALASPATAAAALAATAAAAVTAVIAAIAGPTVAAIASPAAVAAPAAEPAAGEGGSTNMHTDGKEFSWRVKLVCSKFKYCSVSGLYLEHKEGQRKKHKSIPSQGLWEAYGMSNALSRDKHRHRSATSGESLALIFDLKKQDMGKEEEEAIAKQFMLDASEVAQMYMPIFDGVSPEACEKAWKDKYGPAAGGVVVGGATGGAAGASPAVG